MVIFFKKTTPQHIIFKLQKIKNEENMLKETRGTKNMLPTGEKRKELHFIYLQKPCKQAVQTTIFKVLGEK